MPSVMKRWLQPAVFLAQNKITLAGAVLTTSSGITLMWFWIFEIVHGGPIHPYTGIVFFLILPGIFLLGLVLMPLGGFLRRSRLRKRGELPHVYPTVDLKRPVLRRAFFWIVGLTFANILIMGVASYKGVEHMDTVQFCGQTCHTVMSPEFVAYSNSAHSHVACVECHIGSGAPWFVRAKISGARQVLAVTMKTYDKPIPSPVHNLRPARDTCEHCHWPARFTGDKLLVKTKYGDDEANTPSTTVLLMKVGGRGAEGMVGIHGRHLDTGSRVEYVSTDGRRQVIPRVTYTDDSGKKVDYVSDEIKATPADLARGERRSMDCMDCHNRPAHTFELPERAVDEAMTAGYISKDLPYIKKQAVAALRTEYPDRGAASEKIPQSLVDFYKAKYPDVYQKRRAAVETASQKVKEIYLRNVFPEMKVTWGTYPNNVGHDDFLGCFRCHDGKHKSADGKVINDDCAACHQVLAMEEKDPKILADLGLK
jgi:hypothetical protein